MIARSRPILFAWTWLALFSFPSARAADVDLAGALDLYEARSYSAARVALRAAEQKRGVDPAIDFYLGRIALWFDDEDEARERLQRAVDAEPGEARYANALGDAFGLTAQQAPLLTKLGWGKKCLAAYERAVALEPENPVFQWSLLAYYVHAPRIAGGGLAKARAVAARIKSLDPEGGHSALITVHLAANDFSAAIAEAEQALRSHPDSFLALYQFGRCAAVSGLELDRGIAALQRCLALPAPKGDGRPSHALVHYRLASLFEKQGLAGLAAAHLEQVRVVHPDFRAEKMTLKN